MTVFAVIFGTLILVGLVVLVKAVLDAKFPWLHDVLTVLLVWAAIVGGLWFVANADLHILRFLGFISAVAIPFLFFLFCHALQDGERKLKEQNDAFQYQMQMLREHIATH
jgi:hypothetical protein